MAINYFGVTGFLTAMLPKLRWRTDAVLRGDDIWSWNDTPRD